MEDQVSEQKFKENFNIEDQMRKQNLKTQDRHLRRKLRKWSMRRRLFSFYSAI